jgi:hypothetical protein
LPVGDPVIETAGDIACNQGLTANQAGNPAMCRQMDTSNILYPGPLTAVLSLGDTQYETNNSQEFMGLHAFNDTWGRIKLVIYPTIGNHEYQDSEPGGPAFGYFNYFGAGAAHSGGNSTVSWYSFDIGRWHVLSLNANCGVVSGDLGGGGCSVGSAQEAWVRSDLAAHAKGSANGPGCIMAFWHEPLFASDHSSVNAQMATIWQDLMSARADVVLTGHEHSYERFVPQNASGGAISGGITEFIVGTGGYNLANPFNRAPNSVAAFNAPFGVLRMTLHPGSYDWQFLPIPGSSYSDAGAAACH